MFLSFLALLAASSGQSTTFRPSFECVNAKTTIEREICRDPTLAEADSLLARLYAAVGVSAFGKGSSNEAAAQRQWLKDRETCDHPNQDNLNSCLSYAYGNRNKALAVAALYSDPDLATVTLRKLDPEFAPMAEAIVLYASEPVGTDWQLSPLAQKRDSLLALLRPYQRNFEQDEMLSYGRDILDGEGIKTAEDAIKDENSFARFIQVASAYFREGPTPRSMPCGAIVRHPDLIDATDSAFGSTLDNFIIHPDCEETLPPLPQLATLIDRIIDGWPNCEGTIRFSAYRSFGAAVSKARLATGADLGTSSRMPRVKGVSSALVDATIRELAGYYVANDRAPVAAASKLARQKVQAVMSSGRYCP